MLSKLHPGRRIVLAMAVGAVCLVGCQAAHVDKPAAALHAGSEPEAQADFLFALSKQSMTSNDDALHGLILYVDGKDQATDYAGRVKALQAEGILPAGWNRPATDAVTRGDLAVAIVKVAKIKGGLTARLIGPNPRYATRTLQNEGIYPESTPNQTFSGAEFCGVIGKLEDYQRGNSARAPAEYLPGEIGMTTIAMTDAQVARAVTAVTDPVLLNMQAPASAPSASGPLTVVITGVEGPVTQVRKDADSPWEKAAVGMKLGEQAEFRTGIRSAIRFVIPPDQTYTLDRLGTTKVTQAVFDGQKVKTEVAMEQGRVRLDVAPLAANSRKVVAASGDENPYQLQEAGVRHDSTIRSPNSALAVRGTKVSLFDQPPFTPEAVSLTGRAQFENTRRQVVAFGAVGRYATVSGDQTSSAQAGLETSTELVRQPSTSLQDFDNRLISYTVARGGFVRGDVIVGNSAIPDSTLVKELPGALDFVLKWGPTKASQLNDLNLAVVSPLSTPTKPDFVSNPPFTVSLAPNDPANIAKRDQFYPRTSPSGGEIGKNHVGPQGLEIASWPTNYPTGTYTVAVFNLVDPLPGDHPPGQGTNPVPYTIEVFLNKQKIGTFNNQVGLVEIQSGKITVPASGSQNKTAPNAPQSVSSSALSGTGNVLPKGGGKRK